MRGSRRSDGAKKLIGRKRVALVDTKDHISVFAVVPANVQGRETLPALDNGKEMWLSLRLALLDCALKVKRCQE